MKTLRPAIIAFLLATSSLVAPMNSALAQSCACGAGGGGGGYAFQADEAPPPLPVYDQPPIPEPGYLWTPGYWSYNNVDYYWVPGTWVEPPQPGVLWTPGYWAFASGVYVFNRGYWGPHVGFYGGVSYGFGYTGSGYQGGRWDGGVFYYNRSVNNVADVHITNVYNETVVENVTNNRVSFNGGTGGTAAKPTAEEELAAKEPHVKPTTQQIENTRAASMNAGSFAATNHGKPTVAATPRPGVLKGPGVVRAKIAGTSETAPATKEVKPKGEAAPTKEPSMKPEKPAVDSKPTPEKPALEGKPEREKPALEAKPEREKPALEGKPKPERPAVEAKPEREKPELEGKPKPERPAVEAKPEREKPALEAKPEREKPAAEAKPKPETGAKKPECGHPGEPACK
jgi:hypothetical protein